MVGKYENYFYVVFKVIDSLLVYCVKNVFSFICNDYL